jgi:hypothetical protein
MALALKTCSQTKNLVCIRGQSSRACEGVSSVAVAKISQFRKNAIKDQIKFVKI